MSTRLTLKELFTAYKKWVVNNPNVVTDVETVTTWSSYFVAGKVNKSPIVSELIYTLSKLLSLFNDRILREAYGKEMDPYGFCEQLKLWMTALHFSEVFLELYVKDKWGNRSRWTLVIIIQLLHCCAELLLLCRFKQLPIAHPPMTALIRRTLVDGSTMVENTNSYFTLPRSGRLIRRVEGAPPVAFRDWAPVVINNDVPDTGLDNRDLFLAELLHILKPVVHLVAMKVFGRKAWKQWFVALGLDAASMRLYKQHMGIMSNTQKSEINRRYMFLVLYLMRSPMYNRYSKRIIEKLLSAAANNIPMMAFLCSPITHYLNQWQDLYFYMWAV